MADGGLRGDLPPQLWATALAALTAHAGAADLVLALTAVSAIMSLCTTLLEQQQVQLLLQTSREMRQGHKFHCFTAIGPQGCELCRQTALGSRCLYGMKEEWGTVQMYSDHVAVCRR